MNDRPDNQDATYLPERYRQQVKAKKQRRIYKKMVTAGIVIVIVIAALLLLIGLLPAPQPSADIKIPVTPASVVSAPAPVANVTAAVTPGYAPGTGLSTLLTPEALSPDKAVSLLGKEYPAETYTLDSVNLTDRYSGLLLYEFGLQPIDRSSTTQPFTVLNDAVTGEPYTPGQENARISAKQVQDLIKRAVSPVQADLVLVRYSSGPDYGGTWNFRFVKGTTPVLTGTVDAQTGSISSFTRPIQKSGRPAEPVLDMPAAQNIADDYISSQNGPVGINMSKGEYFPLGIPSDPVAGKYVFSYNRIVNDIPCDEEGFVVGIDAASGDISDYERHWSASDNAFSVASVPLVLKREATFAVLQKATEKYPESVNSLRVVSAELKWMDQHPSGVIPRPGSIPLAWKVNFDDDIIRANSSARPAIAWVDAQTYNILGLEYQH